MSLSDLSLKAKACVVKACTKIEVTDTTGVYNFPDNEGGWESPNTVLAADVTGATIVITTPSGEEITVDVLADLPDPVTGEFSYPEISLPSSKDGEYVIEYSIETIDGIKTKKFKIYSLCNSRCCVDKMWSKYAQGADAGECDCGCTKNSNPIQDRALLGESLLKAIKSSAMCNNPTAREALLKKLERLCKLENCNCK
jgi:hypothetical protein